MAAGSYFIAGSHPASVATATASVNAYIQGKNNHTRLYRNGVLIGDDSWSSSGDSSAGTEHPTVFAVPAWPRSALYRWTLSTSANPTTGSVTLASAGRALLTNWPVGNIIGTVDPAAPAAAGLPFARGRKWTIPLTSATGQVPVFRYADRTLKMSCSNANKHVVGIRRPVPAGPFSVIGRLAASGTSYDIRSGIFVAVSGGKANVCGPFLHDNAHGAIGVTTASYTADWSGYDGYLATLAGAVGTMNLFRISWDGIGTISFSRSTDNGATWNSIGSRASMARPDSCGFCVYSNGGATNIVQTLSIDGFWITTP
jgi:hypothetical protein